MSTAMIPALDWHATDDGVAWEQESAGAKGAAPLIPGTTASLAIALNTHVGGVEKAPVANAST